jgi:hypothetical protein
MEVLLGDGRIASDGCAMVVRGCTFRVICDRTIYASEFAPRWHFD